MKDNRSEIHEMMLSELELDRKLESEAGRKLRAAVQSLNDDQVSLAWRSGLNNNLMATIAAKQRKRKLAWILSPALGLGLAGALAAVLFTSEPSVTNPYVATAPSHLEESLIASHRDILRYTDVTGVGLNRDEVVNRQSVSVSSEFSDFDFGSL